MATLSELNALLASLRDQISSKVAERSGYQRTLSKLEKDKTFGTEEQKQRAAQQIPQIESSINRVNTEIDSLLAQLREVENQISNITKNAPKVTESAGQQVQEAQAARDDNAETQNPGREIRIDITTDNNQDVNDDIEGQSQTQSQRQAGQVASGGTATNVGPNGVGGSGAGSNNSNLANDDRVASVPTSTGGGSASVSIPAEFTKRIVPKLNPLSQFASYTYNISLYMLNERDFQSLVLSRNKKIPGGLLLMRSGGAPAATSVPPQADTLGFTGSGTKDVNTRNQFFPLDYYIDDLQMKSLVTGTSVGSVHNTFELSFTITEPAGITLLDNLRAAVQQYLGPTAIDPKTKQPVDANYAAQNYLMVIRFYGYDDYGNMVSGKTFDKPEPGTDPEAVIEKFIPFRFNGIKFRIKNKLVTYDCTATAVPTSIGFSAVRASIPYNVELSADSLKNLFLGPATYKSVSSGTGTSAANGSQGADPDLSGISQTAPSNVSAAPKKTLTSGLIAALNEYQQTERKKEGYIPDQYAVIFEDGSGLAEAKLRKPGTLNKNDTPMQNPNGTAADQLLQSNQRVTKDSKNYSIVAGTQLVQFMDIAIRSSSYITDQQLWIYDETTDKIVPQANNNPTTKWYKILCEAVPLQYDPKRNDFAYKITYYVKQFQINDLKSDYFPRALFRGTHKKYDYWFTGQNTEVIDYEANFDYLYFIIMSGSPPDFDYSQSNSRELAFRYHQTRSDQTGQGGEGKSTEPASNAASILYSPTDQGMVSMTILGDPDWLQQSDIFYGIKGSSDPSLHLNKVNGQDSAGFMIDGSVDYDQSEVLFEVNFNTAADYDDLGNGLINPIKAANSTLTNGTKVTDAKNSFVYRANIVTSVLSKGKFTQQLEGTLMQFPTPQQLEKRQANVAAAGQQRSPVNNQPVLTTPSTPAVTNVGTLSGTLSSPNPSVTSGKTDAVGSAQSTQNPPEPVPPTSDGQPVSVTPVPSPTQDIEVNVLPPGVTRDPVSGAFQYQGSLLVAGTNSALQAQVNAINTGQKTSYQDYDNQIGAVTKTYDPISGTYSIGPAENSQPPVVSSPRQQIVREA